MLSACFQRLDCSASGSQVGPSIPAHGGPHDLRRLDENDVPRRRHDTRHKIAATMKPGGCGVARLVEGLGNYGVCSPVQKVWSILVARHGGRCSVEESYPTPHIHEQMTAYIMATSTSTLSQTR